MTTTALDTSRPGVPADFGGWVSSTPLAPLFRAWADHRTYRSTLTELSALSIRQREDIGLAGHDLTEIARAATRNR